MFSFYLCGDLHAKNGKIRIGKVPKKIDPECKFIIAAGDLTDNGQSSSTITWNCSKPDDQLDTLIKKFIKPWEKHMPVYLVAGNHDLWKGNNLNSAVLDYIIDKYDANFHIDYWKAGCYSIDVESFNFIFLNCYPKNLRFLKKALTDRPTVLVFHYNLQGPYSDFWSQYEKEAFFNVIKDYNIRLICTGHIHINKKSYWKGIPVVQASKKLSKITITSDNIIVF